MATFPPAAPVLSDPNLTASRFLQNPAFVNRRVQELAELRFQGAYLLGGRADAEGGAVLYEQIEGMFADADPEVVAPGAEYRKVTVGDGPAGIATVVKRGFETDITDEAIKRRKMDAVEKNLRKLVNSASANADSVIISLIASQVTQNIAVTAAWTADTAKILRDVLRAKALVTSKNLGYDPNVLLIDDEIWAYVASDPVISAAMAREDRSNPVYSGRFDVLAGLEIVPVPTGNLPGGVGTNAWVIDRTQLGLIATEDLNVAGDYMRATELVETRTERLRTDSTSVRVRTNFAPVVTDPLAGVKITGVKS